MRLPLRCGLLCACGSNNHFVRLSIELEDSQEGNVEEGILPEEVIRPVLPILVHDELRAAIALEASGVRPGVEDAALRWERGPDLIEALLRNSPGGAAPITAELDVQDDVLVCHDLGRFGAAPWHPRLRLGKGVVGNHPLLPALWPRAQALGVSWKLRLRDVEDLGILRGLLHRDHSPLLVEELACDHRKCVRGAPTLAAQVIGLAIVAPLVQVDHVLHEAAIELAVWRLVCCGMSWAH